MDEQAELCMFNLDQHWDLEECGHSNAPSAEDASMSTPVSLSQLSTPEIRQQELSVEKRKYDPKSFRGQLLEKLTDRCNAQVQRQRGEELKRLESRRSRLIQLGIVNEEEAMEHIKDPYHQLPQHVQQRRMDMIARENEMEKREKRKEQVQQAQEIYQQPWLQQKEREMCDLVRKADQTKDLEMKATLESLIRISENKIRLFHDKNDANHAIALEERRKYCLASGLIREEMLAEVRNVYHRLPTLCCFPETMTPPMSDRGHEVTWTPPKTPSWSPRPDCKSPSPALQQDESGQVSPLSWYPPKTPSWSPGPNKGRQVQRFPDSDDSDETFVTPESATPKDDDGIFLTPRPIRIVPQTPSIFSSSQRKRKRSKSFQGSQETRGQKKINAYFSKDH